MTRRAGGVPNLDVRESIGMAFRELHAGEWIRIDDRSRGRRRAHMQRTWQRSHLREVSGRAVVEAQCHSGSRQAVRLRLGLFWLLLASAVSAGPIERLTLAVSPVSSFAPANLVVRVHVTPDPTNRALEVIAESSDYLRSSRIQLDGEDAPTTITLDFRGLPPGDYTVRSALIDDSGHASATV